MRKTISPIEISGIDYPISIKKNARSKRLTMRVDPYKGIINVTTPKRVSKRKVISFILEHQEWLAKQHQSLKGPISFDEGAIIPIKGKAFTIQHIEKRGIYIEKQRTYLIVSCPKLRLKSAIKRYLKEQARKTLTKLAQEKATQIDKSIANISIKDTKTRWGSCSSKNNLNFSWRIIMAPDYVIDYLVAHEVAHLQHMNHSKAFWDLCFTLSKDGSQGKKWLRTHGSELQRYG